MICQPTKKSRQTTFSMRASMVVGSFCLVAQTTHGFHHLAAVRSSAPGYLNRHQTSLSSAANSRVITSVVTSPIQNGSLDSGLKTKKSRVPSGPLHFDEDAASKGVRDGGFICSKVISQMLHMQDEDEDDDNIGATPASSKVDLPDSVRNKIATTVKSSKSNTDGMVSVNSSRSLVRANVQETGSDTLKSYIKNMASHDLLRQEDEVVLGREIRKQVVWEETRLELEDKLLRPPSYAEWAAALDVTTKDLRRQLRRSQRAKIAMMEANLRLVVTIARQTLKSRSSYHQSTMPFQDICQEGILGLSKACERFDPDYGVRFNTFAKWYIRRNIMDNMQNNRTIRLPRPTMKRINDIRVTEVQMLGELGRKPSEHEVAERLGMTVEKMLFYKRAAKDAMSMDKQIQAGAGKGSKASGPAGDDEAVTLDMTLKDPNEAPVDTANQQMLKEDVRRMISTLGSKEQAVVRLRFGLDDGVIRTHDYIAKRFKVTKERIRKIEAGALLKLRQPYRNQSVKCYLNDI